MSQAFGAPTKRRKPSINITSLIDVMFLLLIFFMVSSTFNEESKVLDITLPQAGSTTAQTEDHKLITVTATGELYYQGNEINTEELRTALTTLMKVSKDSKVVLRADADADFGIVIRVADIAREVGVIQLSIPTDPLEAPQAYR
jgi:biopolymer transport protein ExbD